MGRTLPSQLEIVDPAALRDALRADVEANRGNESALRAAFAQTLKDALTHGRQRARERLEQGSHLGRTCASSLCFLMDTVVRELYLISVEEVFAVGNPSKAEHLAVAAVGGYGRGLLAPGSDVDLLFLLPYKQTAWGESVVEFMLYTLWDLGLKIGHATRTVDECLRLAKEDHTICTALLEVRYITGEQALVSELIERYGSDVVNGTENQFVEAKLHERDQRHRRAGGTRYLVEPDVKDGKGGLRDLNTLFWIAKYVYRVREPADLVTKGLLTREEYRTFRRAEDFLWAVRCELHFLTGRAEERITFDLQTDMSKRLGYNTHGGLKGVERFMKHYFLVAKDVGDLTRILCAVLEEQQRKKAPGIGRFRDALRRKKSIQGFTVEAGRLSVPGREFFDEDPVNLIRLFHVAEKHKLLVHPDALRFVTRSLKLVDKDLRRNPDANKLFLEILTSKHNPERILRLMNEVGVLGRFVPDFGRIVALMQFNMYHHYTADEHLLRAIGILSEIERGESDEPFGTEVMGQLRNRQVLYVAMFLHDIAKGRPEDHSVAGAAIAKRLCPRLGMSAADTETAAWLVLNHLVMSDTAQKRDITDPRTIRDFAELVQSPERLKMLYVLTCADIKAVGPGTWNGWKGQLLRQLYHETMAVISGGAQTLNRAARIRQAQDALTDRLRDWKKAKREAYIARHHEGYWLAFDPDTHERHARLIDGADAALVVDATVEEDRDATELTLYTQDHAGLFSRFAGACGVLGLSIVDAKIFTTTDGMALDTLWVQDTDGSALTEERRLNRLDETIRQVLAGEILPPDAIEKRAKRERRVDAFNVEPQVYLDNNLSDEFTVIEVNGLDRPGLLHALTKALFHLGLSISSAHIATYGERAVDTFYVKDVLGQKVVHASKRRNVERQLMEALIDPVKKARPQRPRRREDLAAAE